MRVRREALYGIGKETRVTAPEAVVAESAHRALNLARRSLNGLGGDYGSSRSFSSNSTGTLTIATGLRYTNE
jgi:hypothetical protein